MRSCFKLPFILALALVLVTDCKKRDAKHEYNHFKILSVKITSIPMLDPRGFEWDSNSGPDVFFTIEDQKGVTLFGVPNQPFYNVDTTSFPLNWDLRTPFAITDLHPSLFIEVYDDDTPDDPDEKIGFVAFTLQDHKSGYPKTISNTFGNLAVSITGEWY